MANMAFLQKIRVLIAYCLIALLPFHALIAISAIFVLGESRFMTLLLAWKEVLAIGFILLCAAEIVTVWATKTTWEHLKSTLKLDFLDLILLAYSAFAAGFVLTQATPLSQWAHGIRIDVLPFLTLFFARKVNWPHPEKLVKTVLLVGFITSIYGILQALIIPESWLAALGYAQNIITDVPGAGRIVTGVTSDSLQACPPLEHTSQFCRAISTFGGPTRFGVYLLGIIGLSLFVPLKKKFKVVLLICATLAAILTFSRSVWLGLIVTACAYAFIKIGKKALLVSGISIIIVSLVGIFAISLMSGPQHENPLKSIFARANSSEKHLEYLKNGLQALKNNPLGQGLGTVGPASVRYTPFLTENWFLQLFVEMGVLGGLLFLGLIGALLLKLYQVKTPLALGLFVGILGMCVAGLVTHSFEELAASYMVGILGGVTLAKNHTPQS